MTAPATVSCPCIQIKEDGDGKWSWTLLAHNGRPVAFGVAQPDRKSVLRALRGVVKAFGKAASRIYFVPKSDTALPNWMQQWIRMGPAQVVGGLPPGYVRVGRRTVRGSAGIRPMPKRCRLRRR